MKSYDSSAYGWSDARTPGVRHQDLGQGAGDKPYGNVLSRDTDIVSLSVSL